MQSSFSKSLNKNNPAEANLHMISACTKTGNDFVKLQKKVGVKEQLSLIAQNLLNTFKISIKLYLPTFCIMLKKCIINV